MQDLNLVIIWKKQKFRHFDKYNFKIQTKKVLFILWQCVCFKLLGVDYKHTFRKSNTQSRKNGFSKMMQIYGCLFMKDN